MSTSIKTVTTEYEPAMIFKPTFTVDPMHELRCKQYHREKDRSVNGIHHGMFCFKCEKPFEKGQKVKLIQFKDRRLDNELVCLTCCEEIAKDVR
ncbi:hypothetical protein [Ewingella americana]|uniref:Uncharacterized protein n=1 Tax=Ewingella americana TaxID=41202 RepID=A0A502GD54_9GAMM|nr:hypothetical protein [Ewingella americana]TPG60029.1 hypothetical protein EAH77_15795 [Ewingella americana]